MALCWCREFLTYGIVEASNLLKGTSKSGKQFKFKKLPDGVIVDDWLEDFVRQDSWRYCNGYARNGRDVFMHVLVYEAVTGESVPNGMVVDHINRNRLDNRIENLRLASKRQNALNADKGFLRSLFSSSKYKGVYFSQRAKKWCSKYWTGEKVVHIGTFDTEDEANNARLLYIEQNASKEDLSFMRSNAAR